MSIKDDNLEIQSLFFDFLVQSAEEDKDIEYCLLQSSVEPTIRFKFGSWLNKYHSDRLTLNLMEAYRLDLIVGLDDQIYFIEFGHLLNLLRHGAELNNGKVKSDLNNIVDKANKFINKIKKIKQFENFFDDKKMRFLTCSLFSDIKVVDREKQFETNINIESIKSGTLFKYGQSFSLKSTQNYFRNYLSYIKNKYDVHEKNYLTGYKEVPIIPEQLSLHYKFDILNV